MGESELGELTHLCAEFLKNGDISFVIEWDHDVEDPTSCPVALSLGDCRVGIENADYVLDEDTHWLEALCTLADSVPGLLSRIRTLEKERV